jgi:hypothetical protein
MDITRQAGLTPETEKEIEAMFEYQPWDEKQVEAGRKVREALANAFKWVIECVPPCPDRSAALRKIRDSRMDCNSAITHRGRY